MILLGEQIVKFKDGTQKTLEEFVSESSGGGSPSEWVKIGEQTLTSNIEAPWVDGVQDLFKNPVQSEVLLVLKTEIGTNTNIVTSITLPAHIFTNVSNIVNISMATQTVNNNPYVVVLVSNIVEGVYTVKPFWNYTPAFSGGLKLEIYAR